MSYTVGQLAKVFGLSRSTLLYYDKVGLLRPNARSNSNYRIYSEDDYQRLQTIVTYRSVGMSLEAIDKLLLPARDNSQFPACQLVL